MPKTALVTGSAGFLGRHMVRELESREYQVDGCDLDRDGLGPHFFWYDALQVFREVSVRYDLVVHCAYHVGGRAAIDGTNTNFMKNLQLDAALFEWAVRTRQKQVLYFSSSAVYPVEYQQQYCPECNSDSCQDVGFPLREEYVELHNPDEPDANYGWAKLTGERLAEDARRNGLNVSVVRPFSGYGEDQDRDEYPFPAIVDRARRGDLSVWGPPGQSRDWIHVDDVIGGALAVVDSGTTDPVNLCTGVATEMGELASMISAMSRNGSLFHRYVQGMPTSGITYDTSKPTGVFHRVGDPTRMLKYYTPTVDLEEGIYRALKLSER